MSEYRLREAEEIVKGQQYACMDDDIAEAENEWLMISRWGIKLPEYALVLRRGIICVWDEEAGMHLPDEMVTVIQVEAYEEEFFYLRAGLSEAVSIWLDGGLSVSEAGELRCRIECPE